MKSIINYKFTVVSFILALVFFISEVWFDLDIMDNVVKFLARFEKYEVDELLLAGAVLFVGVVIDVTKNRVKKEFEFKLQMQRLRILKSTIRTMQDLINNLVVALQYFKINAEDMKQLDKESLDLIDSLIETTTDKVNALSNLEKPEEKEIYSGLTIIDYEGKKRRTLVD
jgi:hypothetical protein